MRPQHITAENDRRARRPIPALRASMRPQHITAENVAFAAARRVRPAGFNEAAAYHCGKPAGRGAAGPAQGASMRPQHITAENGECDGRDAGGVEGAASMRPQHITAENARPARPRGDRRGCFNEAAAYHCGKPRAQRAPGACNRASFNEAAAYHCGKPAQQRRAQPAGRRASMRPQHITAENTRLRGTDRGGRQRFNEAAAYHCGKQVMR